MAENVAEFVWTRPKEQAALLLAEGKLSDVEIAEKCDVSARQLYRWKAAPEFEARRAKHVADWIARVEGHRLAHRAGRLERRYESLAAIDVIKQERGEELKEIAGGKTGYICRDLKGKDADREVFAFDAALYREERSTLMEIADELGQLVKRTELTGKDGGAVMVKRVIGVPEDEV